MTEIGHRTIQTNGIRMHIAEAGSGPLVVLCHGFPESWYSWRHQLTALAEAGFHAVAPDQRGYGQTEAPEPIEAYTQLHLTGDILGLLDALGEETAVIAGHDWGAPVAWNSALFRPDRFRAVIGLSVPYRPREGSRRPTDLMRERFGSNFFYQLYFQTPGVAEHELQHDIRLSMRKFLYSASGDAPAREVFQAASSSAFFLEQMLDPGEDSLPPWLTNADLDFFTAEFERSGFRGGLNWYRNIDRNWELTAPWTGARVQVPALFVAGDKDGVIAMSGGREAVMKSLETGVANLRDAIILPGCGHWTQQERPQETSQAMVEFLRAL
jgi:pimeloyl-ACP methyl ester carboxylesterase